MPFRSRRILLSALLALAVCALVGSCSRSSVFQDVQLWSFDLLVNHGGYWPPSKNIVFVDFDDEAFSTIGKYPIPRDSIAEVLAKISSARPRVIALDVLLSEPRTQQEDERMQQALTAAGNVILSSQAKVAGLPGVRPMPRFCDPEDDSLDSGFCREGAMGALGYASINMPVDRDGFIRRFFLFSEGKTRGVSFPVMAAQQFTGAAIQPNGKKGIRFLGHTIPFDDSQSKTVLIGRWGPSPAATIPALSVLRGGLDAELIRDKLVLIGQGSDAARDRHLTPLFRPASRGGTRMRIPGTQIHAAAIETLLSGGAIGVVPNSVLWTVSLLVFTCAIWLLLRVPLSYGLLATGCGFLLVYVTAQLLFSLGHRWFRFSYLELGLALCVPVSTGYRYLHERLLGSKALAEREQVMGLFSRYVSPDVAREIWERRTEVVLAGEERTATVVFSDIRSFTALTAGKPSDVVLQWLNEYLTTMDDIITQEHGFLNKFIGDGLMILFGVPLSSGSESDAVRAVRCAQRMVEGVAGLNRLHAGDPRFPCLKIGVGIHTGTLTCGNIGSSKRLEYSVIGETVNLASRLESLTKEFHTDIVMSEATYLAVRNAVDGLNDLGPSPVRGFDRPIHLYSINSGTRAPASIEEDLSSKANI